MTPPVGIPSPGASTVAVYVIAVFTAIALGDVNVVVVWAGSRSNVAEPLEG
jgi:hypothetical protein